MRGFFNTLWKIITFLVGVGLIMQWAGWFDQLFPQPENTRIVQGVPYDTATHQIVFPKHTQEGIRQTVLAARSQPTAVPVYRFQDDALTRNALNLINEKASPWDIAQVFIPMDEGGATQAIGAYETIMLAYGMAVKIVRWQQGRNEAAELIITSQDGQATGASLRVLPIREGVPYIPGQSKTISLAELQQTQTNPIVVQDSSLIRGLKALGYTISQPQEVITNYQQLFPNQPIPFATQANGQSNQVKSVISVPVGQE